MSRYRTWIGVVLCGSLLLVAAADEESRGFRVVTNEAGVDFVHRSPFTKQRHTHLTFGSGIGWLDFDRDGWPDLYCAQGTAFDTQASESQTSQQVTADRLYQNLGAGRFRDVSRACGLEDDDYSMGLGFGDFNNDGFADVYVSNFGPNRLLINNGDGTLSETAAALGVDHHGFGASVTWVDLDADGLLDLFATNYLAIDVKNYPLCTFVNSQGEKYGITCHPRSLSGTRDVIYRNNGDGTFADVSKNYGLADSPPRQGLGVVAGDVNDDGRVDIYVANDSVANDLWINDSSGRLINQGLLSGTALNRRGEREAGMGVVLGDVTGDGRPEIFVTNYYGETNTLYRNEIPGLFLDVTDEIGLAGPSRTRLGFGTNLFDFDNDGWLDFFVANGHVHDRPVQLGRDEPFAQLPQLFENHQGQRFSDISAEAGPYFQSAVVGRSSAAADYDRDGRVDLAVGHLNSRLALLHNEFQAGRSLALELIGTRANRDGIGAVLEVQQGDKRLTRFRVGSSGYLSCDEGSMTVGLGENPQAVNVTVRWPGGTSEVFPALKPGKRHVLIEGQGGNK